MSDTVLSVANTNVSVGSNSLLKEVSFDVKSGDHLALIGANGAGKSTMMKVILGICPSAANVSGEVSIQGEKLATLSRSEIAKRVAYVPQLLAVEIPYTVREFVAMGRYVFERKSDAVIDKAMDLVGVAEFAERTVSTLSGGERQRVCIAAALAQETPIVLLDEPLAHLDPGQRVEVQRTLRAVGKEVTMVVVTHDLRWVQRDFQQVVALKKGEVVFDGGVESLRNDRVLQTLFGFDLTEEELSS